jgi:hypothetical protein
MSKLTVDRSLNEIHITHKAPNVEFTLYLEKGEDIEIECECNYGYAGYCRESMFIPADKLKDLIEEVYEVRE